MSLAIDELQVEPDEDDSLWYITSPRTYKGRIDNGYYSAIDELRKLINSLSVFNEDTVSLIIDDSKLPIKVTLNPLFDDQEYTWTLRPVQFNEIKGILWTELNDWQKCCWEEQLKTLKYDIANQVILNGSPVVPEGSKLGFYVDFVKNTTTTSKHQGFKFFESDGVFRASLVDWLEQQKMISCNESWTAPSTIVVSNFSDDDEDINKIIITRVSLDKSGSFHDAPWPSSIKKKVVDSINTWKYDKNSKPIPIGIGENCFDEIIPVMEPEHQLETLT
ncbi:hypothetical protein [Thalassomonas sp. M1454]|uniref:hypothetical protein n=1 Tax=Thalassomonas sp. M1454 TaxID=2594477 RepID=UPI00117DDB67|nr:hypothetical protein [Thalassomonas sp. M1454]TRX52743.1 hypothetical protein FNN08_15390 [Thalassomonas sp. M1454]